MPGQKYIEIKFYGISLISIIYILNLMGCASVSYLTPGPEVGIPGIYHRVGRGETLWRISKIYQVDLDEIVRVNHIADASNIEAGQLILIPGITKAKVISDKTAITSEDFIWPLKGKIITYFGSIYNNMVNKGLNIQPYRPQDTVVAARSGRVVFCAPNFAGFGKTIIIDHGDNLFTVYAQNKEILVGVGENVQKATPIAKAGSYLHFEIRKGHLARNPYFYLVD
ncbi:MAG: peptidoglycan DD-metalloendopeptidase family protein [Candidatus Omnitrophica bacterium]|nr:peptidoglycan DD-metalloendopeptidase family protein [Candidatus Omnitrophota bacterium]